MEDVVSDVHSITTAPPGWRFSHNGEQVVCFALVSTVSHKHPSLGTSRMIIPVAAQWLGMSLLGYEVIVAEQDIEFAT